MDAKPPFKEYGVQCVRFAMEESNLFRLLFMQKRGEDSYKDFIKSDANYEDVLNAIQSTFSLSREQAEVLYRNLWIYTHGVAVIVATGMCELSIEEISDMLVMVCHSFLIGIKAFGDEMQTQSMQKGTVIKLTPTEWVLCPKCKQESIIDAQFFNVEVSKE